MLYINLRLGITRTKDGKLILVAWNRFYFTHNRGSNYRYLKYKGSVDGLNYIEPALCNVMLFIAGQGTRLNILTVN